MNISTKTALAGALLTALIATTSAQAEGGKASNVYDNNASSVALVKVSQQATAADIEVNR